ncbi:sulfotransferase family protein [uncultured Tateyamaria sp.]|uniref:sulfotransferase family protein n=1 Tax=Tateyamaria sp. 1078 TaxID=3417464 RepID=UPI00261B9ECA|nr:sulfotransferase family protein [uncultured Tateyamaria sp.]
MKVFGIGFHKTGTTSLAVAFKALGMSVTGPNNTDDRDIADTYVTLAQDLSKEYDSFQDNPWPLVYREMDEMWPDAKFILTTRDADRWVKSQVSHFGARSTPMRELIYGKGRGMPFGNEEHYKATMLAHNDAVRAYFAGREGKLLEIDITKGHGWDVICPFLGIDIPEVEFPHRNDKRKRSMIKRVAGAVRRQMRAISAR